tara:strand:+ start:131 stop:439 length:309 start_codon:yes stop_codon:yes gene_type:complete
MDIPNIYFESKDEFIEQMNVHAHTINLHMIATLEVAILINEYDPIIAYLNDDYELRLEHTDWITNLENTLIYFEEIEDYVTCDIVVTLIKKVETFLGKDLVN